MGQTLGTNSKTSNLHKQQREEQQAQNGSTQTKSPNWGSKPNLIVFSLPQKRTHSWSVSSFLTGDGEVIWHKGPLYPPKENDVV